MVEETPGQLSAREQEILQLVATGATNQQIALQLIISINTVKTHLRNIFAKLDVESRTEATLYAIQAGIIKVGSHGVGEATTAAQPQEPLGPERIVWPLRPGQWVALSCFVLFVLAVAVWPSTRAQPAGARSRLVDAPLDTARVSATTVPSRWQPRAQMPTPRGRFAQVTVDGLIYVIGGLGAEGWTGRLEVYDPVQDIWSRRAPQPVAVANIGAALVDDLVYVPGGLDSSDRASDRLAIYDPATDTWSRGPDLPAPLCAYAIAAQGQGFYLFGGWDGRRYVDTIYYFDTVAQSWETVDRLGAARAFLAGASLGETIFLTGGYDGQTEYALLESYRPAAPPGERWAVHSSMNAGRAGHAMAVLQGDLYVVGGGWERPLAFNERYDVTNGSWSTFESPILGEWTSLGLSTAENDDGTFLYAVGGWNGAYLASVEAYQTVFRVFVP